MKIYDGENLRNVALVGHADAGKTQLVSALLFAAGAVNSRREPQLFIERLSRLFETIKP